MSQKVGGWSLTPLYPEVVDAYCIYIYILLYVIIINNNNNDNNNNNILLAIIVMIIVIRIHYVDYNRQ